MRPALLAVLLAAASSCLEPVDDFAGPVGPTGGGIGSTGTGGGVSTGTGGGVSSGTGGGGGGGGGCGAMPQGADCSDCHGQLSSPTCDGARWVCLPTSDCRDAGTSPDAWTAWQADEAPFIRGEQVDPRVCAARPQPGQLDLALGPFPRASATTGGARLEIRNETAAGVSVYLANGNFGPMELTLGQPALLTQPYGGWWCGQDPGLHVDPSSWAAQLGGVMTVDLGGVVARLRAAGCYEWEDLPAGCYRVEFCTFPQGPFTWPAARGTCAKTVISLEPGHQTQSTLSLR